MTYKIQLVAAEETPSRVLEDMIDNIPSLFPFPLEFIVEQKRYSVGQPSIHNPYFFFENSSNEYFIDVPNVLWGYSRKYPLLLLLHQPYTLFRTLEYSYRCGYNYNWSEDFVIGGHCVTEEEPSILTAAIRRTISADNLIVAAHEIGHSIRVPFHDDLRGVTKDGIEKQTQHCKNEVEQKKCIMNPPPISPNCNVHESVHLGFCSSCTEKLRRSYLLRGYKL